MLGGGDTIRVGARKKEMGTGSRALGLVVKTLLLIGGAVLLKQLTKSTTRWDHARIVGNSLTGRKFSMEQASRAPDNYFNFRHSGGLLRSPFDRYFTWSSLVLKS
ncbi:hypothetical protein FH972_013473 [Carpinus fangiana]|uniref:Uncharacterized protein n=1 Tax=Carpinus fangiana TaxID=176857 RepID=A0A5N6RAA7_9ROSI|nr:hypothetical protein FH972_013473 [Carpinus fangiana]